MADPSTSVPAPQTSPQTTNQILMIRPARFGFNPETASSNSFQSDETNLDATEITQIAQAEFDNAVHDLLDHGVDVFVVEDTLQPEKTDAVFPNNWVSFHADGTLVTYPMMSRSRRNEIRPEILESIAVYFRVNETWAMDRELENGAEAFLEGTGSMVLDRENRLAFACRSPRTDESLLHQFCERLNYRPVLFDAVDDNDQPIYHTNVIMAVTEKSVVICLDSITRENQRDELTQLIRATGKQLVEISFDQVKQFAGNMLQVQGEDGKRLLVMSQSALDSLTEPQKQMLGDESELMPILIPTIEKFGGGSARCMMAEIFLPLRPETSD